MADFEVHFAGGGVAWDDDAGFAEGAFFGVEVEGGHAFGGIGAVAGEAVVGEDGADLAVEVYICRGAACVGCGAGGGVGEGKEEKGEDGRELAPLGRPTGDLGIGTDHFG